MHAKRNVIEKTDSDVKLNVHCIRKADGSVHAAMNTLGAKAVCFVFSAVTAVIVARCLGTHGRGVWAVALLLAALIALVSEFGLGASVLYFMRSNGMNRGVIVSCGLVLATGLSILSAISCCTMSKMGLIPLTKGIPDSILLLALSSVALIVVLSIGRQSLLGFGDLGGYNMSLMLQSGLLLVGLSMLLICMKMSVGSAIFIYVLSLALTVAFTLLRILYRQDMHIKWDHRKALPMLAFGIRSHVATVALFMAYRADVLLVKQIIGLEGAGIYSIALSLSEMLRAVPEVAQTLVWALSNNRRMKEVAIHVCPVAVVLVAIGGITMGVASHWIVPWAFGLPYQDATPAFWALIPGMVGLSVAYSLSPLLIAAGRVNVCAYSAILALTVMVIADIVLIPSAGLIGASIGSSIAYCVLAVIQAKKVMQIHSMRASEMFSRIVEIKWWSRIE